MCGSQVVLVKRFGQLSASACVDCPLLEKSCIICPPFDFSYFFSKGEKRALHHIKPCIVATSKKCHLCMHPKSCLENKGGIVERTVHQRITIKTKFVKRRQASEVAGGWAAVHPVFGPD